MDEKNIDDGIAIQSVKIGYFDPINGNVFNNFSAKDNIIDEDSKNKLINYVEIKFNGSKEPLKVIGHKPQLTNIKSIEELLENENAEIDSNGFFKATNLQDKRPKYCIIYNSKQHYKLQNKHERLSTNVTYLGTFDYYNVSDNISDIDAKCKFSVNTPIQQVFDLGMGKGNEKYNINMFNEHFNNKEQKLYMIPDYVPIEQIRYLVDADFGGNPKDVNKYFITKLQSGGKNSKRTQRASRKLKTRMRRTHYNLKHVPKKH